MYLSIHPYKNYILRREIYILRRKTYVLRRETYIFQRKTNFIQYLVLFFILEKDVL